MSEHDAQQRIIIDFDNTMGVPACDVDDGIALLALLGNPELAHIEGICTTYGNSTIETVRAATDKLVAKLGLDVPVLTGAAGMHPSRRSASAPLSVADPEANEAARFMAEAAAREPGKIRILATGSLTNLGHAAMLDPRFFENVAAIDVMGGIERTLTVNGRIIHELNLSCDAAATARVLCAPCPVSIASSQRCLPCVMRREDLHRAFGADAWLSQMCDPWFDACAYISGSESEGTVLWDVIAALHSIRPELFDECPTPITVNERLLGAGYLEHAAPGVPSAQVNLPEIKDPKAFKSEVLASLSRACERYGL